MPIEVTVVDVGTVTHWVAAATRIGEIEMTTVQTMVDNVIAHLARNPEPAPFAPPPNPGARPARLSRLNVLDHGNDTEIEIGTDVVDTGSFPRFRAVLARLTPHFAPGAFAHLQHCDVGQNIRLMQMFADCWRVPIVGGAKVDNPVYRFNWGNYVRVHPARPDGSRPPPDTFFWRP